MIVSPLGICLRNDAAELGTPLLDVGIPEEWCCDTGTALPPRGFAVDVDDGRLTEGPTPANPAADWD